MMKHYRIAPNASAPCPHRYLRGREQGERKPPAATPIKWAFPITQPSPSTMCHPHVSPSSRPALGAFNIISAKLHLALRSEPCEQDTNSLMWRHPRVDRIQSREGPTNNPFAKPPAVLGRLKAVERILE